MKDSTKKLVEFLKTLADGTRLEMIDLLKKDARVSEDFQKSLNKSQSTISQHLKWLSNAGIITFQKEGTKKMFSIRDKEIFNILIALNSFLSRITKEEIESLASLDKEDTLY